MWAWLTENWSGILAGLAGGSLLTLSFQKIYNRNRIKVRNGSMVDQSGARAGRDIVGGNNTTNTRSN